MFRKIMLAVLCAVLTVSTASCVPGDGGAEGKDLPTVVMTFQTMGTSRLDGLPRVEKAINEITAREAGFRVSFRTVDAVRAASEYPVWLSQGERVDLMVLNYVDITGYVTSGSLTPLDDLLTEYAPGILKLQENGTDVTGGAALDGVLYGLNAIQEFHGSGSGLWIPERYLRQAEINFDSERIYTMEELDALFAKLKALYPNACPFGQITAGRSFSSLGYIWSNPPFQAVSDSVNSGVLSEDGRTLVDFFETERYRTFLEWMHSWYEAGYIRPDAAYTGTEATELLKSGAVLSVPLSSTPGMFTDDAVGEKVVCLRTGPVGYGPNNSRTDIRWVIPNTAQEPEAAMTFLNMMYTDARIVNLLAWGTEGENYVIQNDETGIIAYPEGKDRNNVDYVNPLGLYGNQSLRYYMGSDELWREQEAYSAGAVPVGMEYAAFSFDSTSVTVERELVQQVLNRYLPVLESGCVDTDAVYPEFISALKEAGIDTVIAEKQRQLDAFLAEQ